MSSIDKGNEMPAVKKARMGVIEVVEIEEDDPPMDENKRTLRSKRGTRDDGQKSHWALANPANAAKTGTAGHDGRKVSKISAGADSPANTPPSTKFPHIKLGSGSGGKGKPTSQLQKLQTAARLEAAKHNEALRKEKGLKIKAHSWVDRNFPANLDELFVHKKKVDEVVSWMKASTNVLNDGNKPVSRSRLSKICVVMGPSGAGKTATVFLAAKELGLEIKEWVNPMHSTEYNADRLGKFDPDEIQGRGRSQFDIFSDFLFRSSQYSTIPIKGRISSKNKLIVVEDFPNLFYKNSEQFHNNILRPFVTMSVFPVIFIIADSTSREINGYNLFPKSIIEELNIACISFNGVANSFMVKFMTTVCCKEGVNVDKSFLESVALASSGDIRCAVNTLQFKLAQESGTSSMAFKAPINKNKKTPKSTKTSYELGDIQKDDTLFLFRLLGKVLYSKRNAFDNIECDNNVPPGAVKYLRTNPLDDNPECFVEKIEVSADMFLSLLQQNYPHFFSSMDDIDLACGFLADAEFLLSRWSFDDAGTAARSYKERESREEIALLIASRGLMYSNIHKTKNEFRPMKKSMQTDARTRIQKSIETAKQTFPCEGPLQMSFYSEIIPFYNKLLRRHSSNWMKDQRDFIIEMGSICRQNRPRWCQDSLREKDAVDETEDENTPSAFGAVRKDPAPNKGNTALLNPSLVRTESSLVEEDLADYIIEEFSDED